MEVVEGKLRPKLSCDDVGQLETREIEGALHPVDKILFES